MLTSYGKFIELDRPSFYCQKEDLQHICTDITLMNIVKLLLSIIKRLYDLCNVIIGLFVIHEF